MRTVIILTVLIFIYSLNTQAQNLLDVNSSKTVNLIVDFSKASIHNLNENEFSSYEPDYTRLKPEVIGKLAEEFNESGKVNFMIGNFPKSSYSIKVTIVSVSTKGNVVSYAEILDQENNLIAKVSDLRGSGGTFGSKMNLMGDGCKSTGKVLAKELAKLIKMETKRKK